MIYLYTSSSLFSMIFASEIKLLLHPLPQLISTHTNLRDKLVGDLVLAQHPSLKWNPKLSSQANGDPSVLLGRSQPIGNPLRWLTCEEAGGLVCPLHPIHPAIPKRPPLGSGRACAVAASSMQENLQNVMICC